MKIAPLVAALVALALPLRAQKMQTPTGEAPGPCLLGTIGVGKGEDGKTPKTTALKGLAIKLGEKGEAAVAYDLDLCRMVGAWTGKFTTPMNLMSRGEYPTAMGEVAFTTGEVPGFRWEGERPREPKSSGENQGSSGASPSPWKDPRPQPFGPLPPGQARFKGFYVNGDKTILKWDVGGTEVLEMPGYESSRETNRFIRDFRLAVIDREIVIPVCVEPRPAKEETGGSNSSNFSSRVRTAFNVVSDETTSMVTAAFGDVSGLSFERFAGQVVLRVRPGETSAKFRIVAWRVLFDQRAGSVNGEWFDRQDAPANLDAMIRGGPARWPEVVVTAGEVSDKDEAYVVDTIKLPDPNPWNAPMFVGGFDFFPDGRAAVCTFHGDVFIVSGIDEKLEKVTWRRFASGLYHALGLKIVNGEIYVTCRDGLWRLKDLNGDGECDFYEAFNHDVMVTKSFHEFVFDLQTDAQGNFYFAKAGPVKNGGRGFDEICAHHGAMLRVSPDGKKLEVMATGFRAPNGIGVGPRGELTSGDNEGTWTPTCKINWIKPGGFYGVVPLAHGFRGIKNEADLSTLSSQLSTPPYDRPLCWLPKRVDNSGGAQVWVTSDKWGPWNYQLLHLSYGACSVFGVMKEALRIPPVVTVPPGFDPPEIPATLPIVQGGVVRFPVNFQSGIMRARFNPKDGQLYVAGLRGWQTTGVKNGCFQRVRYTGAPVRMPIGLAATKKGVRIDFTCELDSATASDVQNWSVEVWNYLWSSAYGSPEISTIEPVEKPGELGKEGEAQFTRTQMAQKKHDPLTVKNVMLSKDGKTVFLELPEIKPVMQMAIKFGIKSADGVEVRSEIVNSIHVLGE